MQTVIIVAVTLLTAGFLILIVYLVVAVRQLTGSLQQANELMERAETTLTRLGPTLDRADVLLENMKLQAERVDTMVGGVYSVYKGAQRVKDVVAQVGENIVHSAEGPGGGGARIALAALEGLKAYLGFRKARAESDAAGKSVSPEAAAPIPVPGPLPEPALQPDPPLPRT